MSKLFNCIINKNSSLIPVWFMRQAGRYLPEFREIRKKNQNFIKLCLEPNLVSDITIQPLKRFELDAAIIFSDILMIPYGLGQHVEFKKGLGPNLGELNPENIINTNSDDFVKKLSPIYEGITQVRNKINNKSLIGFVGAPWTLLVYMLNKNSPKKNFNIDKILKNETLADKILKKIEEAICLHVSKQVEAGADVIQIFDSWAGLLPRKQLEKYCFIPNLKIVEYIKKRKIPTICFPRGIKSEYVNFCSYVKPDCINIDYDVDPQWIKDKIDGIAIQGGLDPKVLLSEKENIKKNVEKYLNIFKNYPYIFNLGHGVLPETKPETIEFVIKVIKNK